MKISNNWAAYKKSPTECNNLLKKSKRDSRRNVCQEIADTNSRGRRQKCLMKGRNVIDIGSLVDPGGNTMSIAQTLEILLKVHFQDVK